MAFLLDFETYHCNTYVVYVVNSYILVGQRLVGVQYTFCVTVIRSKGLMSAFSYYTAHTRASSR